MLFSSDPFLYLLSYVETDAKYIKGMLNNPDIQPTATINRWIAGILLFNFNLIHVPSERRAHYRYDNPAMCCHHIIRCAYVAEQWPPSRPRYFVEKFTEFIRLRDTKMMILKRQDIKLLSTIYVQVHCPIHHRANMQQSYKAVTCKHEPCPCLQWYIHG